MNLTRAAAAAAGIVTVLLLQATVFGPFVYPSAASLPALVVAIVALRSPTPATGTAFGFVAGLVADLASQHVVGVLAFTWTALGVVAGSCAVAASRWSFRQVAAGAAGLATLATVAAGVLLTATGEPGAATTAALTAPVTLLVLLLTSFFVTAPVTVFLRSRALRPQAVPAGPVAAASARRRAAGTGTAGDELAVVHRA